MKHRNIRGKILYMAEADGQPLERGREWFSMTVHEDGQRTVRSHCEIDAGLVADRTVIRDVTYTVDREFKPLDGFVRLHESGKYLGTDGAWSVYPYFASGTIAVSDFERGLFILSPN